MYRVVEDGIGRVELLELKFKKTELIMVNKCTIKEASLKMNSIGIPKERRKRR